MSSVENDLIINPDSLNLELSNLPILIFKYGEESIKLETECQKLELKIKLVSTSLAKQIRKNPEQFSIVGRVTDAKVQMEIEGDSTYVRLKNRYIELDYQRKLLALTCKTLEVKRDVLKYTVQLHTSDYQVNQNSAVLKDKILNSQIENSKRAVNQEILNRIKLQKEGNQK